MGVGTHARLRPLGVGYTSVSLALVALAAVAWALADLEVAASDPWADMARLGWGILHPDLAAIEWRNVANTVAFAVLGVACGATGGLLLALIFARSRAVRTLCASLRAIHEIFWALILIQIAGLSATTGVLAIALPYCGIFAKVFSEMIEEADLSAAKTLPPGTPAASAFFYARLPDLARQFETYTLYRLECGMRSTLVLGFVGLPTIGFNLESYFKQGHYAQAAALVMMFYVLIGTRRLWMRPLTLPLLVAGSLWMLPGSEGAGPVWANTARFFSHDIVPEPLRHADLLQAATWDAFGRWFWPILSKKVGPGLWQTLVLSQIALVAMAGLSLLLFPLVSRRFAGRLGQPLGRVLLVVVRSTPEYMIAYVLLQIFGPSMLPAVVALSLHNGGIVGYLMGRHADALDYRLDAPRGANLYVYETVPRLYGQFLAYVLYRWEIILRESAIFGILGVKTLGWYVDEAISLSQLDVVAVLLVGMIALSIGVDALSRRLRGGLRITSLPVRLSAAPGEAAEAAAA